MSRVFLTGASGFVGRRLLPLLADAGPVTALARVPARLTPESGEVPGVTWVAGDLDQPAAWRDSLAGCDAVAHLGSPTGKASPESYSRTIVAGTRSLLDAAREHGVGHFLHVSTIAAAFRDRPRYFYADAKEESERLVAGSGLRHTIVRPTMVFGAGASVLAGLGKLAGAPVTPVFGDGAVRVQPIDVADLAADLAALLVEERFEGETIDLGGPESLTIEALLRRIREAQGGGRARVLHVPLRPVRGALALLEPLLLPLLPLTCGQLATFANDGTARPHAFTEGRTRCALADTLATALGGRNDV